MVAAACLPAPMSIYPQIFLIFNRDLPYPFIKQSLPQSIVFSVSISNHISSRSRNPKSANSPPIYLQACATNNLPLHTAMQWGFTDWLVVKHWNLFWFSDFSFFYEQRLPRGPMEKAVTLSPSHRVPSQPNFEKQVLPKTWQLTHPPPLVTGHLVRQANPGKPRYAQAAKT